MRKNNFDVVRLALASVVVLFHCLELSQAHQLDWLARILNSRIAVEGFFAISGFLIFASYERCKTLAEYLQNRAWRILPGYWMSTLFCLALAFLQGHFQVGKFLLANLSFLNFLQPGIPGMFEHNPGNSAINGALWTIKIEVTFYFAVPAIIWLCRKLQRDAVLWTLFALSIVSRMLLAKHEIWALQLPGQMSFFMIGALVQYHLNWFKRHGVMLMLAAAAMYVGHIYTGWFWLRPAAIAGLTMGACHLLPHFEGPTRWGDFSYGTYILHYPIIQSMVAVGFFAANVYLALAGTIALVILAALFSWFGVEKPALTHAKSQRLRSATLSESTN